MSKSYHFGQLNPATMPQNGKYVDRTSLGFLDSLKQININDKRPSFLKKIYGPLKGVVLKVETNNTLQFNTYLNWANIPKEICDNLLKVRVRIPELHAHLPEPKFSGDAEDNAIIDLYPVFVARDTKVQPVTIHDIVWVDYIDRQNLEEPILIGKLNEVAVIGAIAQGARKIAKKAHDYVDDGLKKIESAGDNIKKYLSGEAGEEQATCAMSRDMTKLPPKCNENEQGTEQQIKNGNLVVVGSIKVTKWLNNNGTSKLVRSDLEKSLREMQAAFIRENGLKNENISQFINDAFRSYDRQKCYYEKYEKCLGEWNNTPNKDPEKKPYPVARPGFGKHIYGNAIDFNKVLTRKGPLLWNWLLTNSRRFGWIWRPDLSPQEPWHYEFDEALARSMGMIK